MYKFFWSQLVKQVSKYMAKNSHLFIGSPHDIEKEHFSLYSFFWWLNYADQQNFELSIDVDGPKMFIFLNTVLMNNISISKKLSHSDSYISYKNPENFKFELHKIFARKPLKKIKRNVMGKLTKLVVVKMLMHQ
jgi:hypothetical protein